MSTNKKVAKKYNPRRQGTRNDKKEDYTNAEELTAKRKGKNDIGWHVKSDSLLNEAASIPWSWATGRRVPLGGPDFCAPDVSGEYRMPGIMALRTAITPGTGMVASDALNIAAQAIYTDVRRMLKSANQYEASDVMIYLTAVGEVIAYISWLTRLYATTMLYSYQNAYLPDALLRIQGVDPDDLHNHALEFLSRANQLIAKAACIYLPSGLDFLDRCRWEYANYYSEGDSIKDQIYMITPGLFRTFGLDASQDYKGGLYPSFIIKPSSMWTTDMLLMHLEDMIEALIGDSDFANIAGDLFNRYGEGGVFTFSLIPQDAVMSIISGPAAYEVLEQIQNSRCLRGVVNEWSKMGVDPSTGRPLNQVDMFKVMQGASGLPNQYLTIKALVLQQSTSDNSKRGMFIADAVDSLLTVKENPSAAKTMLITRFQNMIYGVEDALTEVSYWVEAAADLVLGYDYVYFDAQGAYTYQTLVSGNPEDEAALDEILMRTSPFHYWPTMYLSEGQYLKDVHGSFDIIAPITVNQLKDINRVDLMSLFAVPDIGRVTGK